MILNQLDLGGSHPFAKPKVGQALGTVAVEGIEVYAWARGSYERKQSVSFWIKAWQATGGAAANSSAALKYLLKQVEEVASNRDVQPVFIQWTATADPSALLNATEAHDGWYIIDDFEPDYGHNVVMGLVQCRMTVTHVAPAAPRRVAVAYTGGAMTTNYSGTAVNLVAAPVGSTALDWGIATFARVSGEGSIPCALSPLASPWPILLSTTLTNIWKGGVHVYDTLNTGSNPVPVAGGTFVHANWVEVFGTDHDFVGDCVLTNGLQLLLFQATAGNLATCYLWNTATATANWQQYATLNYVDNSTNFGVLRAYTLVRVGPEECALTALSFNGTAGNAAMITVRLQRGRYEVRTDFKPLTQAATVNNSLALTFAVVTKIFYNSSGVADAALSETSPAVPADYGYGAAFTTLGAQSFIAGFLYQNKPGFSQPFNAGNNITNGLGDNTSLAINAQRSYGIFAVPYGVNGSYDGSNLKAEAESGTLGTGWTSQANGAASGGNEAKCASGTTVNNSDYFPAAWVPAPGAYDVWFRVKVTSAAGAASEMELGLWDTVAVAYVASTTYRANQVTTGYAWYRVATAVTPTATHSMQFRARAAATIGTDWFIDEAVLAPKTLTATNNGPQDLAQQFLYDRSTEIIRP